MPKKQKQKRHSFIDRNSQRWLQCKLCYEYIEVGEDTGAITCSKCVIKISMAKFPETIPQYKEKKSTGRPPGWHFMNEFVDKKGNVFHKGEEQLDLKGTLEPTKVKPRKKKKKLTADEKLYKTIKEYKKRKKGKKC